MLYYLFAEVERVVLVFCVRARTVRAAVGVEGGVPEEDFAGAGGFPCWLGWLGGGSGALGGC